MTLTSNKNDSLTWKVVESHSPRGDEIISKSSVSYDLKEISISNYKKSEVIVHIFLEFLFQDWKSMVHSMNIALGASKAKCKKFAN